MSTILALAILLVPVLLGHGPRALPNDLLVRLAMREERRFPGGRVHLGHDVGGAL